MSTPSLRDYQQVGVEDIRAAFRQHRSVLFVLPTGGGKTFAFSYMAAASAARGRRVLLLVHRNELVEQASASFHQFGIEHGIMARGRSETRQAVQIGMVGTVVRRLDRIYPPDFVIVDEAHHATAAQYRKIVEAFPRARILGVTATPQRTDGAGLGDIFSALVVGPGMRDLIDRNALSPYRLFIPPQQIDTSSIKTVAGDYDRKQLATVSDRAVVTGDAVEHYRRLCNGQAVAFCTSLEHAEHVAAQFRDSGIPAERIDGRMTPFDRSATLARYAANETRVLASCDLISEGFDLPAIQAAILLRPTQSLIVYLQQVGRALRPSPGKPHAVILDHAGNALRHGFPDDQREWTLEGRRKGERAVLNGPAVTICRDCFAAYLSTLHVCPHCGGAKTNNSRTVECRDGELVEITPAMERQGELRTLPFREAVASLRTIEDVKLMRAARGYKPGWAIRTAMETLKMSPHEAVRALGYHPGILSRIRHGT